MKYKVGDKVVITGRFIRFFDENKSTTVDIDDIFVDSYIAYNANIKNPYSGGFYFLDIDIDHEATARLNSSVTSPTKSEGGSLRYNEGKPEFSHLSPQFILEMSKLMTKSAEKYSRQNWLKKQDLRTASDSMFRHFTAFMSGQDNDEGGSEMSHLLHIAVNAMIMWENYEQYGEEVDNRFYKTIKEKLNG